MGVLSRRSDLSAILAAHELFASMVPATCVAVCVLAIALARRPRRAALRACMLAVPVVVCLALLEVPAAEGHDIVAHTLKEKSTRWIGSRRGHGFTR
jgi:hypothetical protein